MELFLRPKLSGTHIDTPALPIFESKLVPFMFLCLDHLHDHLIPEIFCCCQSKSLNQPCIIPPEVQGTSVEKRLISVHQTLVCHLVLRFSHQTRETAIKEIQFRG